jgi:hypothetical protein
MVQNKFTTDIKQLHFSCQMHYPKTELSMLYNYIVHDSDCSFNTIMSYGLHILGETQYLECKKR